MSSRMDKYKIDNSKIKQRTEIKAKLYAESDIQTYNEMDLDSNVSILKGDCENIDIDKIREMLDKKYRENIPRRKSINIEAPEDDKLEDYSLYDTKEYNINEIIAKAKNEQCIDYLEERLKKLNNTNNNILENLDVGPKSQNKTNHFNDSDELLDLINTITLLEKDNQDKKTDEASKLLDLCPTEQLTSTPLENSFFTGNLVVTEKDFEDFKDIQKDIKSNSILIKLLVIIFLLLIFGLTFYFLNNYFEWKIFII